MKETAIKIVKHPLLAFRYLYHLLDKRRLLTIKGKPVYFGKNFQAWHIGKNGGPESIVIERDIHFGNDVHIAVHDDGKLHIGAGCYFRGWNAIQCNSKVTVGPSTLIGEFTSINDSDHNMSHFTKGDPEPFLSRPILIGSHVWIGRGCAILKGVSIGDNAIVGANSVVTRDVAPDTVVAGCPAKLIRKLKSS